MSDSNVFTITFNPAGSPLASACAALTVGNSLDLLARSPPIPITPAGYLGWQTAFYHDDLHGLIHVMDKPVGDTLWSHYYYTIATNVWTQVLSNAFNNAGHVYGNFTMDFETGDVYCGLGLAGTDGLKLRRWDYTKKALGAAAWGLCPTVDNIVPTTAGDTTWDGVGFHPNLYGTGQGAAIAFQQARAGFVRTNDFAHAQATQSIASNFGDLQGANCYWPAQNCVFLGGFGGESILRVTPNPTLGGAPVLTQMSDNLPIDTAGNNPDSANFGSLHVHPGDPNKLIVIETTGTAVGPGNRVWHGTMSGPVLNFIEVGTHPFLSSKGYRIVCSLRGGLGCMWGMSAGASLGNTPVFNKLWRPPLS